MPLSVRTPVELLYDAVMPIGRLEAVSVSPLTKLLTVTVAPVRLVPFTSVSVSEDATATPDACSV